MVAFPICPWLCMGPVVPVPTQLPLEHTALAAITALETMQTHKQPLSNQVPIHSRVERVHIQVTCLAHGHSATPRQLRPAPKTSRSKVASRSHRATTPGMHDYGIIMYSDM